MSAYSVAGKKPLVQVSGTKFCQIPAVLSVYCGYFGGFGSFFATARIFEEISGEYSSVGGVLVAMATARRDVKMTVRGNIADVERAKGSRKVSRRDIKETV